MKKIIIVSTTSKDVFLKKFDENLERRYWTIEPTSGTNKTKEFLKLINKH